MHLISTETASDSSGFSPVDPNLEQSAELLERVRWLVRLRWVVTAGAAITITAATAAGIVEFSVALSAVPVLMALANLGFARLGKRSADTTPPARVERIVGIQIIFDLTCLAVMLQLTGGADNPLEILLVLPAAVAGMLLPARKALVSTLLGLMTHVALVMAEFIGRLPHNPLRLGTHALGEMVDHEPLSQSPAFVAGHIGALLGVVLGVLYIVSSLVMRIRQAEGRRLEQERVAASRARLARIGSLAAGVAHSIRNPLHGLGNCVDMLRARAGTPTDPDEAEIVELMDEGVRRIQKVTERLLGLTHDQTPGRSSADMEDVIRESLRFLDPGKRRRGVEIRVECEPVPRVELAVDRFCEALANIVDNAVDASPDGACVVVRVSFSRTPTPAVRVEVEDQGNGIPADVIGKVFDPFFTTKPIGEGTGLGLAIARRVVEVHAGTLSVSSEPGQGTTVCIELPVVQDGGQDA